MLVAQGKANEELAAELVISERTARMHVSNILSKLDLASRTQAALWAVAGETGASAVAIYVMCRAEVESSARCG